MEELVQTHATQRITDLNKNPPWWGFLFLSGKHVAIDRAQRPNIVRSASKKKSACKKTYHTGTHSQMLLTLKEDLRSPDCFLIGTLKKLALQ
jgi:hypothetical protein